MSKRPPTARRADMVDLHVYGGTFILGVGLWLVTPALGVAGVGAVLLILGLWRS